MGIIVGGLMIYVIPYILRNMGLAGKMIYTPVLFELAVLAGIIITVTATIGPALKSSKLNIIEAIKYE